jgi:serine/threonine-protein phosphatase 2B regulatory subunit
MGLRSSCLLARTIFKIFDVTETKKINFRTWVTTLSALSENASLEEKIRFSFGLYDLNGDGKIDIDELRSLLQAAIHENVVHISEDEVKQWCDFTLSQVDKDGNGTVEFPEYREMVTYNQHFLFSLDTHCFNRFSWFLR